MGGEYVEGGPPVVVDAAEIVLLDGGGSEAGGGPLLRLVLCAEVLAGVDGRLLSGPVEAGDERVQVGKGVAGTVTDAVTSSLMAAFRD
ncbi:MAG: hypothetical protein ACR2JU_08385 [Nocardioidaceae bacterium]